MIRFENYIGVITKIDTDDDNFGNITIEVNSLQNFLTYKSTPVKKVKWVKHHAKDKVNSTALITTIEGEEFVIEAHANNLFELLAIIANS